MASVSTARSRATLFGLALAGALAGSAGGAAAQYYDDYEYGYAPPRGYSYNYGYSYGYGRRYVPAPEPLSPRMAARIAVSDYGLAQVERTVRGGESFIVEGRMANGRRTRLVLDLYSGDLIRRVNLQPPAEGTPVLPPSARIDPRSERPALPHLPPLPPERPAGLKPPAQANIPAPVAPPSPAAPLNVPEPPKPPAPPAEAAAPATQAPVAPPVLPPAPEPVKPAEQPPVEANAPATAAPVTPAPPVPEPAAPADGEAKPRLVNPNDVRGSGEPERAPPLTKAEAGASPAGAGGGAMPPVQVEDPAPSVPRPETPMVPVAPLD